MTKDEALKLALEALGTVREWEVADYDPLENAITAIRQALAETDMGIDRGAWDDVPDVTKWVDELRGGDETEQEPVAFVCRGKFSTINHCEECEPLYTAPPKRKWQGLTQEDIPDEYDPVFDSDEFIAGMAWAQAKLKEKNT